MKYKSNVAKSLRTLLEEGYDLDLRQTYANSAAYFSQIFTVVVLKLQLYLSIAVHFVRAKERGGGHFGAGITQGELSPLGSLL